MNTPPIILLIDDDPPIQRIVRAVLADEGYQVLIAGDGIAALQILESACPDLILLDWMMPRMDGAAFMQVVRARACRIPVILLTARHSVVSLAVPLGIHAWILKPFDVVELTQAVSRNLEGSYGAQSLPPPHTITPIPKLPGQ